MFGKVGLVMALASGSCKEPVPVPEPARAAPVSSSPAQAAPPTPLAATEVYTPLTMAIRLIDSITGLTELSKASLERLFGISMTHLPSALADEQYYEAPLDGPFARVEVRVSNSKQQKFEMVMLTARSGMRLTLDELRAAGRIRAGMPVTTNPRVPPAGTLTFLDPKPGQTVKYTFTANTQLLTGVVVERRPGS
ncbi:MAG: hypothetical protein ABI895_41765 [Deltaproteobacteria bacterium]